MYRCYFCQGTTIHKTIAHMHMWKGRYYLFEDVSADVCQQCGETYFSPDVLEVMDTMATSDMEPKAKVAVPVFSMADTAQ